MTSLEFVYATSASACLYLIAGQGIERILAGEMEVQEMANYRNRPKSCTTS